MSEKIADFSLNHAGTTYTRNEAGQVVSYLNFEGEVSAYGGVYGTMKVVEEFTEASATSGTCSWIGEALNEDGTRLLVTARARGNKPHLTIITKL